MGRCRQSLRGAVASDDDDRQMAASAALVNVGVDALATARTEALTEKTNSCKTVLDTLARPHHPVAQFRILLTDALLSLHYNSTSIQSAICQR